MYIAVPDSLGGMGGLKATDVRRMSEGTELHLGQFKIGKVIGNVHMRSTPCHRSFPNVAFETVPMFV